MIIDQIVHLFITRIISNFLDESMYQTITRRINNSKGDDVILRQNRVCKIEINII